MSVNSIHNETNSADSQYASVLRLRKKLILNTCVVLTPPAVNAFAHKNTYKPQGINKTDNFSEDICKQIIALSWWYMLKAVLRINMMPLYSISNAPIKPLHADNKLCEISVHRFKSRKVFFKGDNAKPSQIKMAACVASQAQDCCDLNNMQGLIYSSDMSRNILFLFYCFCTYMLVNNWFELLFFV